MTVSEAMARTGLTDRTVGGHSRRAGRQGAPVQPVPVRRSRGDRLDRLYGPRQFRHQHPGRLEIRLFPALGRAAGQYRRHAVPGSVGQARHRHRTQSRRTLPRAFSQARRLGFMDRQRSGGDGDRPCRIPRRRHWPVAASAYPADRRHGDHRRADLRHSDGGSARLSPDGDHHRRLWSARSRFAISSKCSSRRSIGARRRSIPSRRNCPTPAP